MTLELDPFAHTLQVVGRLKDHLPSASPNNWRGKRVISKSQTGLGGVLKKTNQANPLKPMLALVRDLWGFTPDCLWSF
uniref:Uncharacterized protein n=1 Tax=Lepeophtheirus salmonis TaxID=72036 RepID=A0A0K2T6W4_LEPSM